MQRIKNISFFLVLLLLFGCIKPYNPQIESKAENKYVVSGRVTDAEGWQEVEVSLSTPIESGVYLPVSACTVNILDEALSSNDLLGWCSMAKHP